MSARLTNYTEIVSPRKGGNTPNRFAHAIRAVLATLSIALLSGCYVVHEDEIAEIRQQSTAVESYRTEEGFNEQAFVDDQWQSEIVPYVDEDASPLVDVLSALREDPQQAMEQYGYREVADPKNPFSFIVEGTGQVVSVSTDSRAGTAQVDLAPTDGSVDIILQLGPVYQGSALRDGIEFLRFGDFRNQIEWAAISTALKEHAGQQIFSDMERSDLAGETISFAGAFSLYQDESLSEVTPRIMPTRISIVDSNE